MEDNRVAFSALDSPVWAVVKVAEIAAETYDRAENPGKYGDEGSTAQLAEWFPKLRDALDDAGLLDR